jgi:chromosome partitioning protein
MALKIVLANRKGGVGKTTTALNLAANLASMGYRVLAMDFDPQSNLTISFGINILSLPLSLAHVFEDKCSIEEVIVPYRHEPNLDIVPSTPELEKVIESGHVANHLRKNELIKFKFEHAEQAYHFVIMDTPPSKSTLTMNSLAIADYVVVPMRLDELSTVGLKQMGDLIADVKAQWLNPKIRLLGLLGTFYERNTDTLEHMDIISHADSPFKDYLFETKIRKNVALSKSIAKGMAVIHFDKGSHGYDDYDAFTRELLRRLEANHALPLFQHASS